MTRLAKLGTMRTDSDLGKEMTYWGLKWVATIHAAGNAHIRTQSPHVMARFILNSEQAAPIRAVVAMDGTKDGLDIVCDMVARNMLP